MIWRSRFVHCVPVRISPVAVRLQYIRKPRYHGRQDGLEEHVVIENLYHIVSDKIVGVNLLMAQEVVIFPVVSHFTQPLHVCSAGLRPRPAGSANLASKSACF